MKVLLTGASGFVGSHILDRLLADGISTRILLRPTSGRAYIPEPGPLLEVRSGSVEDRQSLRPAFEGVTHVIHCAGCVKSLTTQGFYAVNQIGTRNLVEAANGTPELQRFLLISSLAAAGPAPPHSPAIESRPPNPVSEYGRSKLAGEKEVIEQCKSEYVILRPPAVYGPRDAEFHQLFKAVQRHIQPRPPIQPLSLVFVKDLAGAAINCLSNLGASRKTFFVAHHEVVSAEWMARTIAQTMSTWTVPVPIPMLLLQGVCLLNEGISRFTGKPRVLSLQKVPELRAAAWVCDATRLRADTGYECSTSARTGLRETLDWYRKEGWL